MFTVNCRFCRKPFSALTISNAMILKRDHEEKRHIEAKIETDTATQS